MTPSDRVTYACMRSRRNPALVLSTDKGLSLVLLNLQEKLQMGSFNNTRGHVTSLGAALLVLSMLGRGASGQVSEQQGQGARKDLQLPNQFELFAPAPWPIGERYGVHLTIEQRELLVELDLVSVRSPSFVLLVDEGDGHLRQVAVPPPVTVRGHVVDVPNSVAAGTVSNGALRLVIRLPGEEPIVVQPVSDYDPAQSAGLHLIYRAAAQPSSSWTCATPTPPRPRSTEPSGPQRQDLSNSGLLGVQIAFDADFEYFQLLGRNLADVVADIESILNDVEAIYLADVNMSYELTGIVVRTNVVDPYDSTTDPNSLLGQFRFWWENAPGLPHRDVAHLMTGRNIAGNTIGIAFQGNSMCNSKAYGLSQSRYTAAYANRVALTAHEMGHNWNAPHCDGDSDCSIMCSSIGGCSGVVDGFSASSISAILAEKQQRAGCLSPGLVYIDGHNTTSPWLGTAIDPFRQITDGLDAVARFGRIVIRGGTYTEAPLANMKPLTLAAENGSALIR